MIKVIAVSFYLTIIYWIISEIEIASISLLFYPSLGALTFLLMNRPKSRKRLLKVVCAATIASLLSVVLYFLSDTILSFFSTSVATLLLMKLFKLTIAPILSISLIPFFLQPTSMWIIPVSVFVSLGLLSVTLYGTTFFSKTIATLKKRSERVKLH